MRKFLRGDLFPGLALALAAFCVYLKTLSPTVVPGDCGELATAAYTLGISHPTGYPLFTLLGWAFSHLPLGGRVVWRLNLMAAIFCAASVFLFFRLFLFLLSENFISRGKGSDRLAAGGAALILAFSTTFWSQALSVEVYSLHLVFLPLLILVFLRALSNPPVAGQTNPGWSLFAFVLGLSFTNHMMTVLLAPAFLGFYFATYGAGGAAWLRIARCAPPFLLGLSPYLYLPLRALRRPLMNWGDPSDLHNLWFHVSATQYRMKMFSSLDVVRENAGKFASGYPSEFGYAPLFFALLGLWALCRRSPRMLVFSLLLFFGCLLYSVNYEIPDIDAYFLNAYVATAVWILYGLREFSGFAGNGWRRGVAWAVVAVLVALPLCLHYRSLDESRDYIAEDYVKNMIGPLDSGAVILSSDEQLFFFPAVYLQHVEGFRPDVASLNMGLLWLPWYYDQLERAHPALIRESRSEIDAFLVEEREFEKYYYGSAGSAAAAYDSSLYKERFLGVVRSLLWKDGGRAAYSTAEISLSPQINKVPLGLAFRLFLAPGPMSLPLRDFYFRPLPKSDPMFENARLGYAMGYANQGIYRAAVLGDTAMGVAFLEKALKVKPDFPAVSGWLKRLEK